MAVELDGDIGCCNLLVRAIHLRDDDDDGGDGDEADDGSEPSWAYIAQELQHVDDIDGSMMQMILTHWSAEQSDIVSSSPAESRRAHELISVKNLLQQFPSVLPTALQQFLVNPSALPAMHGEFMFVIQDIL